MLDLLKKHVRTCDEKEVKGENITFMETKEGHLSYTAILSTTY